jgi:hypothetical protein
MNPMPPIQSIARVAKSTKRLLSWAHSRVETTVATRMITPPIVGVPRLP